MHSFQTLIYIGIKIIAKWDTHCDEGFDSMKINEYSYNFNKWAAYKFIMFNTTSAEIDQQFSTVLFNKMKVSLDENQRFRHFENSQKCDNFKIQILLKRKII